MQYLRVKNWEKFQHYKHRNPPWIKFHAELLANYDFSRLQDASKAHLVLIWLLASQTNNKIPNDPKWIQERIGSEKKPNTKLLIEQGFLDVVADCKQDASDALASCISQKSREEESREEKTSTSSPSASDPVPYNKILDLYHQTLPDHPKVRVLTPARKSSIKQRHIQDMERSLEEWESYFCLVGRSEFLTGKAPPSNGRRVFMADLEWICKQGNFAKIYEGKYHGQI
jgi:hypothetical protein